MPLAGAAEMTEAVRAAHKAHFMWRWMPADQRRRCFFRLADLLRRHAEEFTEM